ncbi:MAG: aminotransferase class III-fold pyridoxal phosphate-dependent enzyme, partial [Gammaproteobacteria bacterium]
HMQALLERYAEEVCAVIVEPLVQGAGFMRMYHPVYLSLLRAACDRYQVHLIADEVAVGFGRTGTLFACEQAGITPDLMCVSKGLTGGYLPLAAVLATEPMYQAFYDDYVTQSAFLHSHSYSGNPLACRAALATLDIFEQEPVLERNAELAAVMRESTARFVEHPHVAEVRQQGMILAIELVQNKAAREHFPWQQRRGRRVFRQAMDRGALLRPMGDVVYFMPPYVITSDEIRWLSEVAWGAIDQAARD